MDDSSDISDDEYNHMNWMSHWGNNDDYCDSDGDASSNRDDDSEPSFRDHRNFCYKSDEETDNDDSDVTNSDGEEKMFYYRDGGDVRGENDSDTVDDIYDPDVSDEVSDTHSNDSDVETGDTCYNYGDFDSDGDCDGDGEPYVYRGDDVYGSSEDGEYHNMCNPAGSIFYNRSGTPPYSVQNNWGTEYAIGGEVGTSTEDFSSCQEQRASSDVDTDDKLMGKKFNVFQSLDDIYKKSQIAGLTDNEVKSTSLQQIKNFKRKSKLKLFFKRKKNKVHAEKNAISNPSQTKIPSPKIIPHSSQSNAPLKSRSLPTMMNLQQVSKKKHVFKFKTMKKFSNLRSKGHKILMKIPGESPACGVERTTPQSDSRDDDEVVVISCVPPVVLFTRQGLALPVLRRGDKSDRHLRPPKGDTILDKRKLGAGRHPRKHGNGSFCLQGPKVRLFLQTSPFHINRVLKKVQVTKRLETADHVFYGFNGKNKNIQQVSFILEALRSRIKSHTIDLRSEFLERQEFQLVVKGVNSHEFQETVKLFENENNCQVSLEVDSKFSDSTSSKWNSIRSPSPANIKFIFDASKVNDVFGRQTTTDVGEYFWQQLKSEIKNQYLYRDYFKHDTDNISPKLLRMIENESRKRHLILMRDACRFVIKGHANEVMEMMNFVHSLLAQPSLELSSAPTRGSVDFLKFAAECPLSLPTYWYSGPLHGTGGTFKSTEPVLMKVGPKTKSAIEKLVNDTWNSNLVGNGRDARGLSHSFIRVTEVKRVENHSLFKAYSARRKQMFEEKLAEQRVCTPVEKLSGSKGGVLTTECIERFMKRELYHEVNEHYLFHGTKQEAVSAIVNTGLDPRVASSSCMWGSGVYAAENPTKSDQYTDDRSSRLNRSESKILILGRFLLGDIFVCTDTHPSLHSTQKLTRPPCMQCNRDRCLCSNQRLYDSVMADGKWLFREFVVYERCQCYPEYIITYQRV